MSSKPGYVEDALKAVLEQLEGAPRFDNPGWVYLGIEPLRVRMPGGGRLKSVTYAAKNGGGGPELSGELNFTSAYTPDASPLIVRRTESGEYKFGDLSSKLDAESINHLRHLVEIANLPKRLLARQ